MKRIGYDHGKIINCAGRGYSSVAKHMVSLCGTLVRFPVLSNANKTVSVPIRRSPESLQSKE